MDNPINTESGWVALADKRPPQPSPRLIVTNNLNARDAHGHMSHLWLVSMVHENDGEFSAFFDDGYRKVLHLTHWRYAVSAEASAVVGEAK